MSVDLSQCKRIRYFKPRKPSFGRNVIVLFPKGSGLDRKYKGNREAAVYVWNFSLGGGEIEHDNLIRYAHDGSLAGYRVDEITHTEAVQIAGTDVLVRPINAST